jgi:hypothetical protein
MDWLAQHNIDSIDPTRQATDSRVGALQAHSIELELERLKHGRAVTQRNRFDVQRADLILANFLGANGPPARVSIGSVGELFWADAYRKPIVLVRERAGNVHDHSMINDLAGWTFDNLPAALEGIAQILSA